ncbi:MAG: hypothetical protein NT069_20930, partial [Planctomycetota bacterium]|nr:hypothetical protein [Planctomycetota bacterium]
VGTTYQGAVYPLSFPPTTVLQGTKAENANEPLSPVGSGSQPKRGFLGTFCGAQAPNGDLYIGSMHDSGWTGGPNIGEIVRLKRSGEIPLGIESITAREGKFILRFTRPIDPTEAARPERYAISGVTRRWTSGYATPDSGQHRLEVARADVSDDGRTVTLHTGKQQRGFVYEIRIGAVATDKGTLLWPAVGYYTLHDYPVDPDGKR